MKQYFQELIHQAEIASTQEEAENVLSELEKIYHLEKCLTSPDAIIFHD